MKLYYSQGASSLAPHIALHEAGLKFTLEPVDLKTKTYRGGDFSQVNPKGLVPALELDQVGVLTECAVTLQYIADLKPEAQLLPKAGTVERWRALEWINFIATEIHKGFAPLWNSKLPADLRDQTIEALGRKFDFVAGKLAGGFLLGSQYTVADCYLFTLLNWTHILGIDLKKWPDLLRYMERIGSRPAVQKALKEEGLIK